MEEHSDEDPHVYSVAYFFISLPTPIAVPDYYLAKVLDAPTFEPNTGSSIPVFIEGVGDRTMRVSLLFRQIESSSGMHQFEAAYAAAAEAFPAAEDTATEQEAKSPTSSAGQLQLPATVTVVEAACVIDQDQDDPYTEAFDTALDALNRLLRSYYAVSQHAVPLVSIDSLPPMIPSALGEVASNTRPQLVSSNNFVTNPTNFGSERFLPEPLDPVQLDAMLDAEPLDGGPFEAFADLRREAELAFDAGNPVTTVVLYGCVSEALIREIYLLMLWEKGLHPSEAADLAQDRSIADIAKKEFHGRIGGSWSTKQSGPVRAWFDEVRGLRNRVVHSGYLPTYIEARECRKAAIDFERFVGRRLRATVSRFPVTSHIFLGPAGAEDPRVKKTWSRFFEENLVVEDLYDAFRKWKAEIDRYRQGPLPGNASRSHVVLVLYKNAEFGWWLVDQEARVAAPCEAPHLSASQAEHARNLMADDELRGLEISCRFQVLEQPAPVVANQWLPMPDVLPLYNIRPYVTSLVPLASSTPNLLVSGPPSER